MNGPVQHPDDGVDEQALNEEVSTIDEAEQGDESAEALSELEKAQAAANENWERWSNYLSLRSVNPD